MSRTWGAFTPMDLKSGGYAVCVASKEGFGFTYDNFGTANVETVTFNTGDTYYAPFDTCPHAPIPNCFEDLDGSAVCVCSEHVPILLLIRGDKIIIIITVLLLIVFPFINVLHRRR